MDLRNKCHGMVLTREWNEGDHSPFKSLHNLLVQDLPGQEMQFRSRIQHAYFFSEPSAGSTTCILFTDKALITALEPNVESSSA